MVITPYRIYNSSDSLTSEGDTSTDGQSISYVYAFGKILELFAKLFWLLFLLLLLGVSVIAWIWLASFRSGWQLGDWLSKQSDNETQISLNLMYGAIILLITPLALFVDWSQKLIGKNLPISLLSATDLRQIIEKQLGFNLGSGFPYMSASDTKPTQSLPPTSSK